MSTAFDRISSGVVAASAVVVAVLFMRAQLFPPAPASVPRTPVYVEGWAELARTDSRIGPDSAAVQIVEFGDFQCPFCKRFHEALLAVMAERPGVVSLAYRHFPLSYHQHAVPAARAAECAGEQGRFAEMAAVLFADQDSIGSRPWEAFAQAAGVANRPRFTACLDDGSTASRLAADLDAAKRLEVAATPTVLINGWRLRSVPPMDTLRWLVGEFAAGRAPYGTTAETNVTLRRD